MQSFKCKQQINNNIDLYTYYEYNESEIFNLL